MIIICNGVQILEIPPLVLDLSCFLARILRSLSILLVLLCFLNGCTCYKISTQAFREGDFSFPCENRTYQAWENKETALEHPLYHVIPRHRCQIAWFDVGHWTTWVLLGNDDDGIFGEEPAASFHVQEKNTLLKATKWMIRNPLHNFCFYVIGSAGRCNSGFSFIRVTSNGVRFFEWTPQATTVFAGEGAGFYFALHGGKPFISLRLTWGKYGKSEFYIGWRCRGNFGIKCIPFTKWKRKEEVPLSVEAPD